MTYFRIQRDRNGRVTDLQPLHHPVLELNHHGHDLENGPVYPRRLGPAWWKPESFNALPTHQARALAAVNACTAFRELYGPSTPFLKNRRLGHPPGEPTP